MQWLLDNWIIVLLVGGMIGMHLFGHGGHGGGHGRGKKGAHRGNDAGGKHKHDDAETTENLSGKARPHSHDNKDAAPPAGDSRQAVAPARSVKTTDEL